MSTRGITKIGKGGWTATPLVVTAAAKSQHTPTPWRASNEPDGSGIPGWDIFGADRVPVCSMMDLGPMKKLNPYNARLIVTAVNAHEALVAALKSAEAALGSTLAMESNYAKPLAKIRAALALAEVKP